MKGGRVEKSDACMCARHRDELIDRYSCFFVLLLLLLLLLFLPFFFFLYLLLVNHGWKNFFLPLRVDAWGLAWKKRKTTTRLWNSTAVQLNPRWHAVRDEKRQQTFTPSPPPLFHEFYNSAYPSSRAGFFFLFFTNMVGENFNSINPETRMWVNNAGSKGTCVISLQGRFSGEKIDKPCLTVN